MAKEPFTTYHESRIKFEPFSLISVNETVRTDLKKLPALPTQALKEHPSLAYCEDRVIEHYKKLNGQTRGQAIVNYMSIVESLPTYGVHYYAVKVRALRKVLFNS
ncbi:FERM domain-containing protein 4A, partial [Ophiophagus hannah]